MDTLALSENEELMKGALEAGLQTPSEGNECSGPTKGSVARGRWAAWITGGLLLVAAVWCLLAKVPSTEPVASSAARAGTFITKESEDEEDFRMLLDHTVGQLISRSKDGFGQPNCDKAAFVAKDGSKMLTSRSQKNVLAISEEEARLGLMMSIRLAWSVASLVLVLLVLVLLLLLLLLLLPPSSPSSSLWSSS